MKKEQLLQGFEGLLQNSPVKTQTPQQRANEAQKEKRKAEGKKAICAWLPVEVADKVKYISHYDRKPLAKVMQEAMEQYIKKWKPTTEEPMEI